MTATWSQEVFIKAWDFATLAHQGQTYGGPAEGQRIDYINHIGSVAMELIWALGSNPELNGDLAIQCALLHDVIEDTKYAYDDIVNEFGTSVANGVLALTKNMQLPSKQEQMQDSLARIKQQPMEVWMVKMADRITNLSEPPAYWTREKKIAYRTEAQLIYDALHTANAPLAARLIQRMADYQNYIEHA